MRGASLLLTRWLGLLALVVALMPARAGAAPCVGAPAKACARPCCASGPKPSCCAKRPSLGARRAASECGCALGAPTPRPVATTLAPVGGFDAPALAPAGVRRPHPPTEAAARTEPGLFGVDAGPPPRPPRCRDSGRAPPVARA